MDSRNLHAPRDPRGFQEKWKIFEENFDRISGKKNNMENVKWDAPDVIARITVAVQRNKGTKLFLKRIGDTRNLLPAILLEKIM